LVDTIIQHPTADELDIIWVGPLIPSETRCAHCLGPTQRGTYILVSRPTGEKASDPISGLLCPNCGPLNTDGFQLKPSHQID